MLWSSYYPKQIELIPAKGDRVSYRDQPYPVLNRTINEGTVYLWLDCGKVPIEVVNWWPEVGDVCELALKPYLDWRRQYGDYSIPDWFWKPVELARDDGEFAMVRVNGVDNVQVPFAALIVKEKRRNVKKRKADR